MCIPLDEFDCLLQHLHSTTNNSFTSELYFLSTTITLQLLIHTINVIPANSDREKRLCAVMQHFT